MTATEPRPGKQIVKDGVWQVPPELRPAGWKTMAVRESTETHTRTRTVRETLLVEQPKVIEEVVEPTEQPPTIEASPLKQLPTPLPTPDFIPEDDPVLAKEYLDNAFKTHGPDSDKILEGDQEQLWQRGYDIAELLSFHRVAKVTAETVLVAWMQRHREKLRHVGLGSEPMRDLFTVVHGMLRDHIRVAEHKRQKDVRHAAHGDKCVCWDCEQDKATETLKT